MSLQCAVWNKIRAPTEFLDLAGFTVTPVGNYLYLIGGRNSRRIFPKDIVRYDLFKASWEVLGQLPFQPRSYHTATVLDGGKRIWVVGGGSNDEIFSDVHILDTETNSWQHPKLRGDVVLLKRTAHACIAHPTRPYNLLVCGGYGFMDEGSSQPQCLNDLFSIDTKSLEVSKVVPHGESMKARMYHSFVALGHRCFAMCGRTAEGVVTGKQMVAVYDASTNAWVIPGAQCHKWHAARAPLEPSRCSRRQLSFHARRSRGEHALRGCPLSVHGADWQAQLALMHIPAWGSAERSAHGLASIGRCIYVMGGYGGKNAYAPDMWSLELKPCETDAARPSHGAAQDEMVRVEATSWRSVKRSGTAAQAATPAKRPRPAPQPAPAAAAPPGAAGPSGEPPPSPAAAPRPDPLSAANVAAEAQQQLAVLRVQLQQRAETAAKMEQQQAALQREVQRLHENLKDTDERWSMTARERAHFEKKAEAQGLELTNARAANKQLEQQLSTVVKARDAAAEDAQQVRVELAAAQRELREHKATISELDAQVAGSRSELGRSREEWDAKEKERKQQLDSAYAEARMLSTTNTKLHEDITRLTKSLEVREAELKSEQHALLLAKQEVSMERDRKQKEVQALHQQLDTLEEEQKLLKTKLARAETGKQHADLELGSLKGRFQALEHKAAAAETQLGQLTQDNAQLKAEVDREKDLRDKLAATWQQIETHRQAEALAAAQMTALLR